MEDCYAAMLRRINKNKGKTGMDNDKVVVKKQGLGCLTVIGIVFVVLKLLAVEPVASWSWIWVLCPFWISIAITIVLLFLVLLAVVAAAGH